MLIQILTDSYFVTFLKETFVSQNDNKINRHQ